MSSNNEPVSQTSFWITLVAVAVIAYACGHSNGADSEIAKEAKYGPKTDVGRFISSFNTAGNAAIVFTITDTTTGEVKMFSTTAGGRKVTTFRYTEPDTP